MSRSPAGADAPAAGAGDDPAAGYSGPHARYYDAYDTGLPGEADFYRRCAVESGGPVLEPGSGTGRTVFPVAAAGIDVTGVEIAAEMLAIARAKAARLPARVRARLRLCRGDMRHLPVSGPFALVSLPYRTFQHLLTPDDQLAALGAFRDALVPGGRLVLNQFDPTVDIGPVVLHGPPVDTPVPELPVDTQFTDDEGRTVRVRYRRQYDLPAQLLKQACYFEILGADGEVAGTEAGHLTFRYTFRHEMEYLLTACGFRVVHLWGGFAGQPYAGWGEQVWVAERR